jgi:hypothetical protein
MAKTIFDAQAIIGVVVPTIMECMPITKLVITMHGKLAWMNIALPRIEMELMVKLNQVFPPSLQKILLISLLSMTNFATHFALKLVFLLKLLIKSGKMLRDMSRSESWVE